MIHERDRQLTAVVQEAEAVEDIESAAIFVVAPGTGSLQLVAAAGIEGPALDVLRTDRERWNGESAERQGSAR